MPRERKRDGELVVSEAHWRRSDDSNSEAEEDEELTFRDLPAEEDTRRHLACT